MPITTAAGSVSFFAEPLFTVFFSTTSTSPSASFSLSPIAVLVLLLGADFGSSEVLEASGFFPRAVLVVGSGIGATVICSSESPNTFLPRPFGFGSSASSTAAGTSAVRELRDAADRLLLLFGSAVASTGCVRLEREGLLVLVLFVRTGADMGSSVVVRRLREAVEVDF